MDGNTLRTSENARVIESPVDVCIDEKRFDALLDELDRSTRLREQQALIMASAGHNLRQHLQTVLIAADLVASETGIEELRTWTTLVKSHLEHVRHGLERLALEADLERSAKLPTLAPIEVGDVLNELRLRWSERIRAKGLHFDIDACDLRTRSHRDLLLSILDNLLSNALTHTERGGITIRCIRGSSTLRLCVRDTGCGMTADEARRIFDPFWRGAVGETGMGVGLTIVKRAAGLLCHEIAVDSAPGKGTSFTLTLDLDTSFAARSRTQKYGAF